MTKFLAPLCVCLALGLLAAGCGGSSKKTSGGGAAKTTTQPQQTSTSGGATASKTVDVTMQNIAFNPATVTVPVGGAVKWTNKDSVGHDVTGTTFKSGSAGGLQGGDTYSFTFKKAGTYKYRCTIHPGMTGTVTVK